MSKNDKKTFSVSFTELKLESFCVLLRINPVLCLVLVQVAALACALVCLEENQHECFLSQA